MYQSLGIAMQLTNIARDIREDWDSGRRYIPGDWYAGSPKSSVQPPTRDEVLPAVRRMLSRAEELYAEAEQGIAQLPRRARYAIRLAGRIYREIGEEIRRQDYPVMQTRVYVPKRRKIWVAGHCLIAEWAARLSGLPGKMASLYRQLATESQQTARSFEMKYETRYLACVGLSLSFFMAATMFLLMGINPKLVVYQSLPWVYAAGCLAISGLLGLWAKRYSRLESMLQSVPAQPQVTRSTSVRV